MPETINIRGIDYAVASHEYEPIRNEINLHTRLPYELPGNGSTGGTIVCTSPMLHEIALVEFRDVDQNAIGVALKATLTDNEGKKFELQHAMFTETGAVFPDLCRTVIRYNHKGPAL